MTTKPTSPVDYRRRLGIRPFSPAWETFVRAVYGVPLEPGQREVFARMSGGRSERPGIGWTEAFANVGRGGGKDDTLKSLALYECLHGGHEVAAAPGQRLPVLGVTPRRGQMTALVAMVNGEARLAPNRARVARETLDGIWFKNGTGVQVATADAIDGVGETAIALMLNEWALAPGDESSTPDKMIEANLRPTLRRVEGAPVKRLFMTSSSYTREGSAWETFRDHFGRDDSDVLVVQGSTEFFNPNVSRAYLEQERRRLGPRLYAMHFECEWLDAMLDGFFGTFEPCIRKGVESFEPRERHHYVAAIDAGFRADSFALAIAHRERRQGQPPLTVLDYCESWRPQRGVPLSVEGTVRQTANRMFAYGVSAAAADQFCFDALRESYLRAGVLLRQEPWTATSKPTRFRMVRDAMLDGLIVLPEHDDLVRELYSISAKLLKSGGERIEARGSGRDDLAHAAVLALTEAMRLEPDYGDGDPLATRLLIGNSRWGNGPRWDA